jgi:hypothetical protein
MAVLLERPVTRGPAPARRTGGAARVGVPLLVAALALVVALLYPASRVHGDASTGPEGGAHLHRVVLDFRPSLSWGSGRRDVLLTVHPDRPCLIALTSVASTAPGRLNVGVHQIGTRCTGPRRTEQLVLPLPALPDPRRTVRVDVGPQVLRLRWAAPGPHPPGALDF